MAAGDTMPGFDAGAADDSYEARFKPGCWIRTTVRDKDHPDGYENYWTTPPCGHHGRLACPEDPAEGGGVHTVTEHDDGTVTVSPSILCTHPVEGGTCGWHGFLEAGVWREV